MGAAVGTRADTHAAPPGAILSVERLRCALLWLTGLAGAFAMFEPGPYEFVSVLTIVVFAMSGLSLNAPLMPLAIILALYNIGFVIAAEPLLDRSIIVTWVIISIYLSITALFFAAMLAANTQSRLNALMRGYMVAAVVASLVAIGAYFGLFGGRSELFLLYERARGTFNDPNVLGAFLIFPALLALQRILTGRPTEVIKAGALFLLMLAVLVLSFSRGAWGQFVFTAPLLMALTFITSTSTVERLRIVLIAAIGIATAALFVAALVSIDQVAALFRERASFEQSYDVGPIGRFGRYLLGALMVLDQPWGIGPLQFSKFFAEDPHNTYLNSFLSGGWIAGLSFLALTIVTLAIGLRFVFLATPWRASFQAVYVAYAGIAAESLIIDSDHWRHHFMLLGLLWGLMIASRPYLAAQRRQGREAQSGNAAPALARSGAAA
jgi:O-antigen ligase